MGKGYVKVHREVFDSDLWRQSDSVWRVASYLMGKANHKPHDFMGITIEPGQTCRAQETIAEECFKTRKAIRNALETLKRIDFITTDRPFGANALTRITIKEWDKWQGVAGQPRASENNPHKELAHKISSYLITEVSKATGRKLISKPAGGVRPITKLLNSGVTKEEIKKTIDWLTGPNLDREYSFVIQSGATLLERWDKIQAAMNRQPKRRKEIQL